MRPFPHGSPQVTYAPVNSTGVGVLKAAVAGMRHYVISAAVVMDAAGRLGFSGSVSGFLVPQMSITTSAGFVLPAAGGVYFATAVNEDLRIETDQIAKGVVGIFTGP